MYTHKTQIRVRYGETDQMSYVYYGQYAFYYEVGRVEAMRQLGFSYKRMEEELGVFMPVMSMNTKYLRPAYYDELLTLETTIEEMPDKVIRFDTKIFNEKNEWINYGQVFLCFVDIASKVRVTIPSVLSDQLKPYFEK